MRLMNGNIVAGGKDQELYVFDANLKLVKRIMINGILETGISFRENFYCAVSNDNNSYIVIYDSSSLKNVAYQRS